MNEDERDSRRQSADPTLAFLDRLESEKAIHKSHRHQWVVRKLTSLAALFGVALIGGRGGTSSDSAATTADANAPFDLGYLLFLAPFVAILCDYFILVEHFKVHRIGAFVREYFTDRWPLERAWEEWVGDHRETHARVVSLAVSALVTGASTVSILLFRIAPPLAAYTLLGTCVALLFGLGFLSRAHRELLGTDRSGSRATGTSHSPIARVSIVVTASATAAVFLTKFRPSLDESIPLLALVGVAIVLIDHSFLSRRR